MVQASAQLRQRGAQDFMAYYDFACAKQESAPLPAVTMNLAKGMLDFSGDKVKVTDWLPILSSISINKHLHHIGIRGTFQIIFGTAERKNSVFRKKIPPIRSKDMTYRLCKSLTDCLTISPNLTTLHLNGLPLRERDLIILTKGLIKSVSLENLCLANCPIGDDGIDVICQSLRYSTSIRTVDFSGCRLTWRAAESIANIIKHQGMQRHSTAWTESLRYRRPQLEGMGGLRRITLNSNTLIGDRGSAALAHELAEDLWVKALDLQKCGISNEGAHCLLEALKTNSTLCVLDIRSNPLVDKILIKTIIEKLLMNSGQPPQVVPQYSWIKPAATELRKATVSKQRALPGAARGKALRAAPQREISPGGQRSGVTQHLKPGPRCRLTPWRAAAARVERQRGPARGTAPDDIFEGATTVKVTVESETEEDEDDEEEDEEAEEVVVEKERKPSPKSHKDKVTEQQIESLQMELKECRVKLSEERRARLKAESRLREVEFENDRLRNNNVSLSDALSVASSSRPGFGMLEDEEVLDSIERSFNKFHAFLDLFKDAGLGQLAMMAGIDHSDFNPLGQPQLSSTIGRSGAASPIKSQAGDRGDPDVQVRGILPHGPDGLADFTTSAPPSSVRSSVCKDGAARPALEHDIDAEEEADEFSKPETQYDSGSERSFRSQKSFDKLSVSKIGRTESSRLKSHSNSRNSSFQHSNGSLGNSLNYSYTHSDASRSNGSQGGLSLRSSISDIGSDKEESVGSAESRRRGRRRLVTVGQSGSEGSEGKAYPGRETLGRMKSVGSVGGQSDNDSF